MREASVPRRAWGGLGPIEKACASLKASKSGLYEHPGRKKPDARIESEALEGLAVDAFRRHKGRCGCRRIDQELRRGGIVVSGKRVPHIVRKPGIVAEGAARRHRIAKKVEPGDPRLDLVEHVFSVGGRNGLRVGGMTCMPTREGRLCLAAVIDAFSRKAVGRPMPDRIAGKVAVDAIEQAAGRGDPPDDGSLVFHGGQGVRYASEAFRRCSDPHGMTQPASRPKLQAGVELYGLAKDLLHAKTPDSATAWLQACNDWCNRWEGFLEERTLNEETGKMGWTHERLIAARNGLDTLIRRGHLFTFLDPELTAEDPVPGTNNRLEGGVNAPLREMLRLRRGMSTLRRAKAVFWRCCMHSECPLPPAEILQVMPTDGDIAELYRKAAYGPPETRGTPGMGRWPGVVRAAPFKILANRLGLVIHQHVLAYSPNYTPEFVESPNETPGLRHRLLRRRAARRP